MQIKKVRKHVPLCRGHEGRWNVGVEPLRDGCRRGRTVIQRGEDLRFAVTAMRDQIAQALFRVCDRATVPGQELAPRTRLQP